MSFGRFSVHPEARQLSVDGERANVGARAFDVLLALIERRDRVVSKHELFDLVWPGLIVEENNLQVQVSNLRKLLGSEAIVTVPGRGYRFTLIPGNAATSVPVSRTSFVDSRGESSVDPPVPGTPGQRVSFALPQHLPPLLGRDDDVRRVQAAVKEHPLVTLVGAGGIGKTRLAHAVAHELHDQFKDGVCVVELARIADAAHASVAVAKALGLDPDRTRPVHDVLIDALRDRNLLLVLDNCEHLAEPVAALADALLSSTAGVRLLATSQEPLRLAREHQYRLGTLAVPATDNADDAAGYGAVALFVDRARAADPRFVLTAGNTPAVIDICRRLDGIALAIELAAARVALLGVNGLRERLIERFRLLTAGSRFALRRHQTLRAALDWSYGLLSPPEQTVFRRLGVFVGGFTLGAAQALATGDAGLDEWSVLDHLGALVDKSLVVAESGATPRYHLLETTRVYALEELARCAETRATVERHAKVVLSIFERAEEDRFGERGSISGDAFLERLWPEFDNLRAALDWATTEEGQASIAIALAAASSAALRALGLLAESLQQLLALQHRLDDSIAPDLAARFWQSMMLLGSDGQMAVQVMTDPCADAESFYRRSGSPRRLYRMLVSRAWLLAQNKRAADAEALLPEIRQLEDASWPGWLRAYRLNLQGHLFNLRGKHEDALAAHLQMDSLLPPSGEEHARLTCMLNQGVALEGLRRFEDAASVARATIERCRKHHLEGNVLTRAFAHLIRALAMLDRLDEGREALCEAVPYWRRTGLVLRHCEHPALLVARIGRHADAVRLAGASDARREASGLGMDRYEALAREDLLQCLAKAHSGREDIARWMQEGRQLGVNAIVALFLDVAGEAKPGHEPPTSAQRLI